MKKELNVLIVEDHPVIIDIYKQSLLEVRKENTYSQFSFKVSEALNCESAVFKIYQAVNLNPYDLIFLDISLPPSKTDNILSGEDLGEKIKEIFPQAKLFVFTSSNENVRLNNILNSLNPDAFLIKSDVSYVEMTIAIKSILDNIPYYSKTILKLIRKQISSNLVIDKIDRQLLYQLSIGTKMKNLPDVIPMSMAGIERRKRLLKNIFSVPQEDDKKLIEMAKEYGFI